LLCALLVLAVITIGLDFAHGIALGEHNIGFHRIYRFRQTVAIAISRLQRPRLHRYLAYQSVIDALTQNGSPALPAEGGPHKRMTQMRPAQSTGHADG
jgi:hypothetical protein